MYIKLTVPSRRTRGHAANTTSLSVGEYATTRMVRWKDAARAPSVSELSNHADFYAGGFDLPVYRAVIR